MVLLQIPAQAPEITIFVALGMFVAPIAVMGILTAGFCRSISNTPQWSKICVLGIATTVGMYVTCPILVVAWWHWGPNADWMLIASYLICVVTGLSVMIYFSNRWREEVISEMVERGEFM